MHCDYDTLFLVIYCCIAEPGQFKHDKRDHAQEKLKFTLKNFLKKYIASIWVSNNVFID